MDDPDDEPLEPPDNNIVPPVMLTEGQRAVLRERIRGAVAALRSGARTQYFHDAAVWTLRTYAFVVMSMSQFMPLASFGAAFEGLSLYLTSKEAEAEYEEVESPDETNL